MDQSITRLLGNDPEVAAEVLQRASQGEVDSCYAAGLLYAEGRGVPEDRVQSYFWLTRAVDQGDADAEQLRQMVASRMSDREFEQARYLVDAEIRARVFAASQGAAEAPRQ